jgi:O-6-methylguanine DNA methyltransferase
MRVTWAPPSVIRGRTAHTGRIDGLMNVVTTEGDLVLRVPALDATARRRLAGWGLKLGKGPLPPIRQALALGTPFQHKVWQACQGIPIGRTRAYGELAKTVRCGSAQAVGSALSANPLAQLVPCHRVTSATGPGGFAWGLARKQRWLAQEARGSAR